MVRADSDISRSSTGDERTMRRALALAERGHGSVEPNPMVGAVVLNAAGEVVGEGWHERFGGPHAEAIALANAGGAARGGTLVVTLEPCCHRGKTPPCTDAVRKSGVVRVVAAMLDPFPAVAGGGLQILRDNGLSVEVGLLQSEAEQLNAPYLTLLRTGRPWVVAKWAMSLDGRIATRTGDSKWIGNARSRAKVHELRGRMDAILVGRGTLVADDPLLTARPAGPRTATRIVVSASGDLPAECQLLRTAGEAPVIVATRPGAVGKLGAWAVAGAEVLGFDGPLVPELLAELGRRRMTNVLVEGGAGLLGSFRDADLIDEVRISIAPKLIGGDKALSPVGGRGIAGSAEAREFGAATMELLDGDVWFAARRPAAIR